MTATVVSFYRNHLIYFNIFTLAIIKDAAGELIVQVHVKKCVEVEER